MSNLNTTIKNIETIQVHLYKSDIAGKVECFIDKIINSEGIAIKIRDLKFKDEKIGTSDSRYSFLSDLIIKDFKEFKK